MDTTETNYFSDVQHDHQLIPENRRTLDAYAKTVLKYRIVLANLLKYAVPDFMDYDVADLAERITADPHNKSYAQITNIESDHTGLVSIEFDICTNVQTNEGSSVIVNVEPQNKYRPSSKGGKGTYSLAQRGMYYISRLITEQLGVGDLDYSHLKKCYSIWLIFDQSISEPQVLDFKMTEQSGQITRVSERLKKEIDLAELIFITMDNRKASAKTIFKYLNALFKGDSDLAEFIPPTEEFYKEVPGMFSLSDYLEELGKAEGKAEGMAEAIMLFLNNTITNQSPSEIVQILCKVFSLSTDDAQKYCEMYLEGKA